MTTGGAAASTAGGTTARPPRDPAPALWTLTAAGWLTLAVGTLVPGGHLAHPAGAVDAVAGASGPRLAVLATFTAGWWVMIAAMMLPTTVPVARMFTVVSARQHTRAPLRSVFFAAYLLVWSVFALVALGLAVAVHPLLAPVAPQVVLAAALALAGLFQFSSLKKRCLTLCREPTAFLFVHYRRGIGGAWRLGLRHALSCLGCCWALMLVMFASGMGDLTLMLGLTAVMVAEKTTAWGARIGWWVGAGLLVAAVLCALLAGGGHAMSTATAVR